LKDELGFQGFVQSGMLALFLITPLAKDTLVATPSLTWSRILLTYNEQLLTLIFYRLACTAVWCCQCIIRPRYEYARRRIDLGCGSILVGS
jgi:hypothetical protein